MSDRVAEIRSTLARLFDAVEDPRARGVLAMRFKEANDHLAALLAERDAAQQRELRSRAALDGITALRREARYNTAEECRAIARAVLVAEPEQTQDEQGQGLGGDRDAVTRSGGGS